MKKYQKQNKIDVQAAGALLQKLPLKKNAKNNLLYVLIGVFVLFAALITLNERFFHFSFLPKWHEIYEFFGLSGAAYGELSEGEIAVHFIDVGQGDCTLILAGETSILIDSGESSASSDVIGYLNSLELDSLDMVIATHPHSDHIGSLSSVIGEFGTETLLCPELTEKMVPTTRSYEKLLDSAEKCGAKLEYAEVGASYELSAGCYLEILAPVRDYDDLNNYSIAARLTYGETSFLFTGDIEKTAEQDILDSGADVSADVLKVAHHGSSTSSSRAFIQAVSPEYAVIGVGSPNDYGHPHKKTTDLFKQLGITVYRTDRDGNVVWISDGKTLRVETDRRDAA